MASWNYTGTDLTVTVTGCVNGDHYLLEAPFAGGATTGIASGGTVTITVTGIASFASTGDTFSVDVTHGTSSGVNSDNSIVAANIFTKGTASSTGTSYPVTSWSFNGSDTLQVTLKAVGGVTYDFGAYQGSIYGSVGGPFGPYTNGSTQTLSFVFPVLAGSPPAAGVGFQGALTDDSTGFDLATRTFVGGTANSGSAGNPLVVPDTNPSAFFPGTHTLALKIYDLNSNLLADITTIALEKTLTRRLNLPRQLTFTCPAGNSLLTSTAGDGYANLRRGNRKVIMWRNGVVVFHGRIWIVERSGDGETNRVTVTCFDPLMELGLDNDTAGRPVRDATGNFITPKFNAGGPVSGGDLILQVLQNSIQTGVESDPTPGEGQLPIALTGTFNTSIPPAVDLSPIDSMPWPVNIGAFISQLVDSNVVDIHMRPVDPAEGLGTYFMVELSAVNKHGTDKSGTVHFDYWTGSHNCKAARHVADFSTACNKLYDYLGPRIDKQRWRGNITPGSPGTTVDPTSSRALYGTFMSIRIYDSTGTENAARPLYTALWNAEALLRQEPRDMLFLTPATDAAALFDPFSDYEPGDLVSVNTGGDFGVTISAVQRVYADTISWNRENLETVGELTTSADAE
jgi:hypothetical protein